MTKKDFLEYKLDRAKHFLWEREIILNNTYGKEKQLIQESINKVKNEIEELKQQLESI